MSTTNEDRTGVIDFILELFAHRGAEEYMGEPVCMAQHMEQSAACAAADDAAESLVIAALLHDIGHFVGDHPIEALDNGIDNLHEDAGADYLKPWFPAAVTEPIRLHVSAKRYLCATDEEYLDRLSDASVNSLNVQGGPMSMEEITRFEANPWHQDAVKLRLYDDDGKVANLSIKPATAYRKALASQLAQP